MKSFINTELSSAQVTVQEMCSQLHIEIHYTDEVHATVYEVFDVYRVTIQEMCNKVYTEMQYTIYEVLCLIRVGGHRFFECI